MSDDASPHDGTKSQATRNRVNQRNFRLRQQQRVKELEDEVQSYRNAGVQASKEVQDAARLVAAENAVLKDILINQLGFDRNNVSKAIHERINGDFSTPLQRSSPTWSVPRDGNGKHTESSLHLKDFRDTEPRMNGSHGMSSYEMPEKARYTMHTEHWQNPVAAATQAVSAVKDETSATRMSCVKAAEILSSIRGGQSPQDLRGELGCTSSLPCTIDNVRLFEVMGNSV